MVSIIILYCYILYYIICYNIILLDHRFTCGPLLKETSSSGAYLCLTSDTQPLNMALI